MDAQRTCTKCGQTVDLATGFYRSKQGKDGYNAQCKQCMAAAARRRYEHDLVSRNTANRRWREKHREQWLAYCRNYNKMYHARKKAQQ